MKKIVHIILGKANPARMNGVNKVVYELATHQADEGLEVEVWGLTADPVHNYPDRNFKSRLFRTFRNPFAMDEALKQAIQDEKASAIYHLHGGWIPVFSTVARFIEKSGALAVLTPHGAYNTIAMKKSAWRKKIYFNLFEKHVLRSVRYIHSIGKSEVEGLSTIYPNRKSMLIPYGFDLEMKVGHQPEVGKFVVSFCGRIDVYTKGLKELIEGFAKFHTYHPQTELWMIGDGSERGELEQLAVALGVKDAVIFFGSKFGDEKLDLLSKSHVYAAPSRNEGLPAAVIEAAAIGIPCMVTDATNTGDAIRDFNAGLVIPETSASAVYQGLMDLYRQLESRDNLEQMSSNGRKMVNSVYNWKNVLAQFNQMYQQVAATA